MHGIQRMGTLRQLASVMGISVVLGAGAFALSTHVSHAGESCQGLDTALRNNLNFIAGQRAHPDANSAARIANRQAVVDLVQQRRVYRRRPRTSQRPAVRHLETTRARAETPVPAARVRVRPAARGVLSVPARR